MILPWVHHFGKRTAWSLLCFLNNAYFGIKATLIFAESQKEGEEIWFLLIHRKRGEILSFLIVFLTVLYFQCDEYRNTFLIPVNTDIFCNYRTVGHFKNRKNDGALAFFLNISVIKHMNHRRSWTNFINCSAWQSR